MNLAIYILFLLLTALFARAGEEWMFRRLTAKRRPRFEAEA